MNSVSLYPNPNKGSFILNTGSMEIKDISIYNTLGNVVYEKNSTSENLLNIDILNLSEGIYLLKVRTIKTETIQTLKFIVQIMN